MENHYFKSNPASFSKKLFLLLFIIFLVSVADVKGQTQTFIAGNGTTTGMGTNWTAAGNIVDNDNINASVGSSSRYLAGTNFGFSIPAGSIIDGIELEIDRYASRNTGSRNGKDNVVRLVKNGTATGTNNATATTYSTTATTVTYGSSTELWGTTWTAADINATNFGAVLSTTIMTGFTNPTTVYVDFFRIKVYYTAQPTITSFTPTSACVNSSATITINGTNFTGVTDVSLNGVSATYSFVSDTKITATLPNGATTGTVTVTAPAGTGTSASNFTVNPLPIIAAIVGANDVCKYATTTFTNATAGGSWTSSNNLVANINSSGVISGFSNGTATISYTYTNGNDCTNSITKTINVLTPPTITAPTIVCNGETIQLLPSSGGTWMSNTPTVASIDNSGLVTGLTLGNATFTYTDTTTTCFETSSIVAVVAAPQITAQPTISQTICSSNSASISTAASGHGLTYQWYKGAIEVTDGGNISGATTATLQFNPIAVGDVSSDYFCRVTGTCSPAINTDFATIIVHEAITIATQPDAFQLFCTNDTATLSVIATGTNLTYQWYKGATALVDDARISGTTTSAMAINTLLLTDNGSDYHCVISGASPCSDVSTNNAELSISETPSFTAQPALTQTVCLGDSVSLTVTATGGSLNYQWYKGLTLLIDGGTISGSTSATLSFSSTSLSDSATDYTCVISNSCGLLTSDLAALTVNERPFIVNYITAVCSENSFSISPVNSLPTLPTIVPLNTTYSWSIPTVTGGITGGTAQSGQLSINDILINSTDSDQTAIYTVTPTSGTTGFCVGATFTVTVTVQPKPSIINSNFSVCSKENFTIIPTNGGGNIIPIGTTFSWGMPSVSSGISGATAGSGVTSLAQTLTNNTSTIQTATYNLTAKAGSCVGSTFTIQISVKPTPTVAASSITQSICSGDAFATISFSNPNTVAGGIDYSWTRDNITNVTGISASGSGTINSTALYNTTNNVETTTFTVTATTEGLCVSDPLTVIVTVKPIPTISILPTTQNLCSSNTIATINLTNPNNIPGTTFIWTRDNTINLTGISTSGTGSAIIGSLTNTTNIPQTTIFSIAAVAAGCGVPAATASLFVNPKPTVAASPSSQTICGNSTITAINITNPNAIFGTTYSWTRDNTTNITGITNSGTTSSILGTLVNNTNTNQTVQFTILAIANGCPSSSIVVEVIVKPTPQVVATPSTQTKCTVIALTAISLTNPNNVAGTTYGWTRNNTTAVTGIPSSGTGATITGTLTNTTTSTQTTVFTITATAANGCSSTTTATVIIYAPLTAPIIGASQTACLLSTPGKLTSTTLVNGGSGIYTYQWQRSDDNATYTNIPGATASTYQPPFLGFGSDNTYYRVVVTNVCATVTSNVVFVEVVSNVGFSFGVDEDLNGPICSGSAFSPSLNSVHFSTSAVRFRWSANATYITPASGGPVGNTSGAFFFLRTSTANIGPLTVQNNTNATVTTQVIVTPDVYNYPGPPSGAFICSTSPQVIDVIIRPKPVATATIPNMTICNLTASNINITGNITDAAMSFTWIRNNTTNVTGTNSGTSGNIGAGGSFTITNILTNKTTAIQTVRYTITPSSNGCVGAPIIIDVNVAPPSTPGILATSQTICYGDDPIAFTVATAATGLNLTYQWQKSTDNATYTDISGATNATYDEPGPVYQTTWYRRIVFSTVNTTVCSSINTTPIVVTVNTINPGSIATSQTICSGGNPAAFTSIAAIGSGGITYQWQSNTTGCGGSWSPIAGATSATYDAPGGLLVTTYYQRIAYSMLSSKKCSDVSNCLVVYVNQVTPGYIGTDQTLCGNNPDAFTEITPGAGSGTITYQWYKNTTSCNASWSPIIGATSATYDAPAGLLATTYYQRTTISTLNGISCSAQSNCITVTVNSITPGIINGNRTVCYGGDPLPFTESVAALGTSLSYQWQSSTDNITYTNIAGASSATYDAPGPINELTYFRRVVTGTVNTTSCSANSNFVTVFVNHVTASDLDGSQNICNSSATPLGFTVGTPATGTGTLSYQWQKSTTGCSGPWSNISGANSDTYIPTTITQTTYYQVKVSSTLNSVICEAFSNCLEVSFLGKMWNGSLSTNWNAAGNWTPNGVPSATNCVIIPNVINKPIISGTNFDAYANTITILNNGKLTITGSSNLTVTDFVSVVGTNNFIIENNASLVQINDSAVNTGTIKYTRTSRPVTRWAYVYWGSPVDGNIISQLPSQFDLKYRWQAGTHDGTWLPLSATQNGEGFIARVKNIAPFNSGTGTIDFNFTGKPNNGIVHVNVDSYDSSSMVSGNTALLANPYPSTIDAKRFLEHPDNTELGGTLFFWTAVTLYSGTGSYNVQDYGSWNLSGGTGTAPSTDPSNLGLKPNGKIASGQGFFSQIFADGQITFDNSLRESNANSQFFKTQNSDTNEKHRFWLNLYDNTKFRQTLIGYVTGASNGLDRLYDGDALTNNEINIYSILQEKQLVIQGRSLPFDDNDIVPVGYKTTVAGVYTIAIDSNDGLFAGNQAIYLRDLTLNIEHNLKQNPYVFETVSGTFNNRFEIVYKTATLDINDQNSASAYAFINNNQLHVNATIDIKEITLFDITGKLIIKYDLQDASTHFATAFNHANGVYIAKVKLIDDTVATIKLAH
ncbi:beta strand repeat-containing protein [Flavobacterium sp.]